MLLHVLFSGKASLVNDTVSEVQAYYGENVSLVCPAIGNPPVDEDGFQWTLNGEVLEETSRVLTLVLTEDQVGTYTCTGKNSLGVSDPMTFRVTNPQGHLLKCKTIADLEERYIKIAFKFG